MTISISPQTLSLTVDVDGVIRMAKTRVTIDTVIAAFLEGATAEEIVQQYPSLELADVYAVIGYYLRRRDEVEKYLKGRQKKAQRVRQQNEKRFDPAGLRARLLARHPRG
jgi:uncharacterized protein (DUF433 family)